MTSTETTLDGNEAKSADPLLPFPSCQSGGGWLIGNYDGIHLGHQHVIREGLSRGRLGVLTFSPHPKHYFTPDVPPFRLTSDTQREALLRKHGVSQVVTCPFSPGFASLSAEEFTELVLRRLLRAERIIIGENFRFGAHRRGCGAFLTDKLGKEAVHVIPPVVDPRDHLPYSSSRIREALNKGDVEKATFLLGRPWSISATVIHGDKNGQKLGFPTLNLALGDYHRPRYGVYVVWVAGLGFGVANVGRRPTLDGTKELLEVHLFDCNDDLYGREVSVYFLHFCRPEQHFGSFAALQTQISEDKKIAKDWITNNKSAIHDHHVL